VPALRSITAMISKADGVADVIAPQRTDPAATPSPPAPPAVAISDTVAYHDAGE
jgi:hypothetical protein